MLYSNRFKSILKHCLRFLGKNCLSFSECPKKPALCYFSLLKEQSRGCSSEKGIATWREKASNWSQGGLVQGEMATWREDCFPGSIYKFPQPNFPTFWTPICCFPKINHLPPPQFSIFPLCRWTLLDVPDKYCISYRYLRILW